MMGQQKYPYSLPPLAYAYDALEPYVDAETMHFHHDKHFQTYVNNLNGLLEKREDLHQMTLSELLKADLSGDAVQAIRNNGGGVYNHGFFFESMSAAAQDEHTPKGKLAEKIDVAFGSFEEFKALFEKQALSVFGSGWTFLVLTEKDELEIVNVKNQDTVLPMNHRPILCVDVWEHAYYLKYQNLRVEYLKNIWNVLRFPVL